MLYYDDVMTLEFTAEIIAPFKLPDGRLGVVLDRTYFYPTGGGQEYDTGRINDATVIEVYRETPHGRIIHVVDRSLATGAANCQIDAERRLRHMQHHTAQHLLTQCFVKLYNLDTLSANINGYTPSTLDIPATNLGMEKLIQAEKLANQIIYENRPVRAYFVKPGELLGLPLRQPPKVQEDIRLVEIEGFDLTPCGGTHCTATGMIGTIKILKTERQNDRLRVHFAAGIQALQIFQATYETVTRLANQLSQAPQDLLAAFQRQAEQLHSLQRENQALQKERLAWEVQQLTTRLQSIQGRQVIIAGYRSRSASELRQLGAELGRQPELLSLLYSTTGSQLSLVVACGSKAGCQANKLLDSLLADFHGRGGGDARLAQGRGVLNDSQIGELDAALKARLEACLPG